MTSPNSLEKIIPQSLASLFQCAQIQHSGLLGIRTPFQYPDGGIVDIYVEPRPNARGEYEVIDMGDAMLFLSMHTPEGEPSPFQLSFADETCLTIGIEAEHDILKAKAADMDHIAAAVMNEEVRADQTVNPNTRVITAPRRAARLKHRSALLPYADLDGNNRSTMSGKIEKLHPPTMRPPLDQKTNQRSK